MAKTIVQKIWDQHVVSQDAGAPAILAIDLHLIHEVTSPQAFTGLRARGLKVRRPDKDRKSTRLNSSHMSESRMPSSA